MWPLGRSYKASTLRRESGSSRKRWRMWVGYPSSITARWRNRHTYYISEIFSVYTALYRSHSKERVHGTVDTYLTFEEEELIAENGNGVKVSLTNIRNLGRLIFVCDVEFPPMIIDRFIVAFVIDRHRSLGRRRNLFLFVLRNCRSLRFPASAIWILIALVVVNLIVVIVVGSCRPRCWSCRSGLRRGGRHFLSGCLGFRRCSGGRRCHIIFISVIVHLPRN